nr:transposase [Thioalkalivibrio sp. ALE27]
MARVVLPHIPHHVVQRGHNRQVVFAGPDDYERYLEDLRELSSALEIRVYVYCLMTNHVHLLLGPGEEVAAMGQLMKALAARATRYEHETGTDLFSLQGAGR